MSIEIISKWLSLTAAGLTVLAILVAAIIVLAKGIKAAKQKKSAGGEKITAEEWKEIALKLLPFGVKIYKKVLEVYNEYKKMDSKNENGSKPEKEVKEDLVEKPSEDPKEVTPEDPEKEVISPEETKILKKTRASVDPS